MLVEADCHLPTEKLQALCMNGKIKHALQSDGLVLVGAIYDGVERMRPLEIKVIGIKVSNVHLGKDRHVSIICVGVNYATYEH